MSNRETIFITGAASGIGRSTALFFARKGWFVGSYDIDEEGLASLGEQMGEGRSCYRKMDVTDLRSVREAVEHFSSFTGGEMHVLFNCAGILRMGPHSKLPSEEQHLIVDVNLKGILNCINASFELLKRTKDARIINMSSASALYGTAELAVYSATKAAVSSLTESLNLEFERYDIYVNDVRAPYVDTPLLQRNVKAGSIEKMGIKLKPEDVAEVVWKASKTRRLHNNTKGVGQLVLMLSLPAFIRRKIMKALILSK
jgi:NAD(P)-dependent dehydrogenase (short-subunit alcohol dehydrogenase family)